MCLFSPLDQANWNSLVLLRPCLLVEGPPGRWAPCRQPRAQCGTCWTAPFACGSKPATERMLNTSSFHKGQECREVSRDIYSKPVTSKGLTSRGEVEKLLELNNSKTLRHLLRSFPSTAHNSTGPEVIAYPWHSKVIHAPSDNSESSRRGWNMFRH